MSLLCELERKEGYEYIYCIENLNNNDKLYFIDEVDAHFAFDFSFLKVTILRVEHNSELFNLAVDNSIRMKGFA